MMQYQKSTLAAFLSFIILFNISLFLYSCGANNPSNLSNPATSTTGISRLSAAAIDIDSSSGAAKNTPVGQNFGIQALTVSSTGLTTITFDEYSLGTFIATQYASSGVVFSSGAGGTPVIVNDRANPTSPVLSGWPLGYGPITITFTDPNNASKSVLASNVSFDAGYFNALGSTVVTFYDINGNAVGSQTDTIYGFQHFTIPGSVNKVSIVIISFEPGGYCMDNLAFSASGTASSSKPPLPPPPPKPGKLVVSPDKATIYVHPIGSAKGNQQYMAVDDKGNNVTNSVAWQWDNPIIAKIDATGLATPLAPGSTAIVASLNDIISNKAELCVECRIYSHYRQNIGGWKDQVFANHKDNGKYISKLGLYEFSVGHISCHTTSLAIALSSMGFSINPGELDTYLKNPEINGYLDNVPVEAALYEFGRGTIISISGWHAGTLPSLKQEIINELQKCNIIIAEVGGKNGGFLDHYIVIVKEDHGQIQIYDSWFNNGDPDLDNITTRYYMKAYRTIITK